MTKLNPRQKKIAIAVAVGGLLALVVLMRRGGSAPAAAPAATATQPLVAGTGDMPPSTFADNGAAFGQIGSTLTDLAGQLQGVTDALGLLPDNIATQVGGVVNPPGQLATVNTAGDTAAERAEAAAAAAAASAAAAAKAKAAPKPAAKPAAPKACPSSHPFRSDRGCYRVVLKGTGKSQQRWHYYSNGQTIRV